MENLGARTPPEIAAAVESMGVAKAHMKAVPLLTLSVLAGAFISLGAIFFLVVTAASTLGWGPTRLVGGAAFSLGLILVVVGGAELFTGNNLLAMAWASRLVSARLVVRNWVIVYLGNVVGCVATAALVALAQTATLNDGLVGEYALKLAAAKLSAPFMVTLVRGILCNVFVCLAVWLAMAGRSVADKILAIVLPITAFVTLGLEHSIANWFFVTYAWLLGSDAPVGQALAQLAIVTFGNLLGGTVLVAVVYWLAFLRGDSRGRMETPY